MFAVGDSIVVRTGDYTGFTITKDYFQLALHRALANTDLEKPIDCLVSGDALMHYQEDFSDSLSFFPQPQKDVLDSAIFSDKPVINFLSGQYRLKKPAKETRSYWRYVRYAFIAWLVILFAGKFVEWGVYHHQQKKLQSQITKTLNKVLPAAATSDDPKSLIEHEMQRMASQKKQDPFISILANVGSVLKQFPGAGLQTLNFSDNMLDIKLQAKELSVLESFSRALEQHHLVIKQNQVSTGTKSVIGEIKVGRA